jgi:hypothetical protein
LITEEFERLQLLEGAQKLDFHNLVEGRDAERQR